jgi:hypothetical protein
MLVQNNAGVISEIKTVWYAGTDTLQEGYLLCYDVAASPTDSIPRQRLGQQVVKPATANLMAFAGVVTPESAGKTGPCFVDILVPRTGEFVNFWTQDNLTAFSSYIGPQNGSYAAAVVAAPAALANVQANEAQAVAQAAVTANNTVTAAVALARFV